MGASLIEKLQAKLELLRLEKRYTRHRSRRSTFVSNAIYVDGEYIYQTPNSTGSSYNSSSSSSSNAFKSSATAHVNALHGEDNINHNMMMGSNSYHNASAAFVVPRDFHSSMDRSRTDTTHVTSDTTSPPYPSVNDRKKLHRFSSVPRLGGVRDVFGLDKNSPRVQERRLSVVR